jgi:hypothetical protein
VGEEDVFHQQQVEARVARGERGEGGLGLRQDPVVEAVERAKAAYFARPVVRHLDHLVPVGAHGVERGGGGVLARQQAEMDAVAGRLQRRQQGMDAGPVAGVLRMARRGGDDQDAHRGRR